MTRTRKDKRKSKGGFIPRKRPKTYIHFNPRPGKLSALGFGFLLPLKRTQHLKWHPVENYKDCY